MSSRFKELLVEARRRRVFRTTGVYLVGVWAASQGLVELAPLFGAPEWLLRAVLIAAVAFSPFVVILAWMFDVSLSGITRDPKDVERALADEAVARMQTQIGYPAAESPISVRWRDHEGEHRMVFTEDFHIGRASDCRVRFYDPLVSRKHVRVFREGDAWRMQDLGSRNGTRVNGERIDSVVLQPGAEEEIQVNEVGPALRVEALVPDDETTQALTTSVPEDSVAHVRGASISIGSSSDVGTLGS